MNVSDQSPESPPQSQTRELLHSLFLEAVDLPTSEREAFLRSRCANDASLCAALSRLLEADDAAGAFLSSPTVESAAQGAELRDTQIGRYKVISVIGEGGFGTVYLAEQQTPVRRRVALKLIKLGMDTKQVIARFGAERQALAMMDHANIAKVFDAGTTESGKPYFAMEFVDGVPITAYCDNNNLEIRARLQLFIRVCQAVQHAHQKGLIHRDIKPTNILVATEDDRPMPKVIDFGIAKAMQARLSEQTIVTEQRQFIGTPEYISPEQAEGSSDVDTRSDVYSLGVLLYELLTGTTPFDSKTLRSKSYVQILQTIRDVEPARPSTRLAQIGETVERIATQRRSEPQKLTSIVRGELDWIAMKCLEKDRAHRYETVNSLATDVQRYLDGDTVLAAPLSTAYRLRKFVRRNRGPVFASVTVLVVLVAGIIGTTIGMIGQSRQRAVAEQAKLRAQEQQKFAEQQAAITSAVSEFQGNMFESASPFRLGEKVTVVDAMAGALTDLDRGRLKDQPLAEANVREMIGITFHNLGRYKEAEPVLRRALALRREASTSAWWIARDIEFLARTLQELNRLPEAEALVREALALRRAHLEPTHPTTVVNLLQLSRLLEVQANYGEAESLGREAVAIARKRVPIDNAELASSLGILGSLHMRQQQFADAESLCREALEIRRGMLPAGDPDLVQDLNQLAIVLAQSGKYVESEPLCREILAIDLKSLPADHPRIGQSLNNLASVLQQQDKLAEAEPLQRQGLEQRRKSLPPGHPYIAQSLKNLASLLQQAGKLPEAESLSREALAIRRSALPAGHPDVAGSLQNLGSILRDAKKFPEAEAALLEAEQMIAANKHLPAAAHNRCIDMLVTFYEKWNESEPNQGHDAKSAEWRTKFSTTKPATNPS